MFIQLSEAKKNKKNNLNVMFRQLNGKALV